MPKLLIVDDMPLITSTIKKIIIKYKLPFQSIMEAANGIEAVERAREFKPDIALLDIRMPGLDGLEAAAQIKQELPSIQIVFLTAYDDFSYVQKALQLGARDYLLKPVRPNQLRTLLLEILSDRDERSSLDNNLIFDEEKGIIITPTSRRDPVGKAINYIQEHFKNPAISLNDVSNSAHLSSSHLAFLLKKQLGMSYKQFLTQLRMKTAMNYLKETDWTIDIIAESVGYPNVTNFYRLFQRETGVTPKAFRHMKE